MQNTLGLFASLLVTLMAKLPAWSRQQIQVINARRLVLYLSAA